MKIFFIATIFFLFTFYFLESKSTSVVNFTSSFLENKDSSFYFCNLTVTLNCFSDLSSIQMNTYFRDCISNGYCISSGGFKAIYFSIIYLDCPFQLYNRAVTYSVYFYIPASNKGQQLPGTIIATGTKESNFTLIPYSFFNAGFLYVKAEYFLNGQKLVKNSYPFPIGSTTSCFS